MSLVRVVIQRNFKWTAVSLKQREYIDMTPEKQHPTPRLQRAPSTQIKNLKGVETTVQHREPVMKHEIAPQCPWCKTTTIGGLKAIVCPVWPSHSVVEMVNTPSTAKVLTPTGPGIKKGKIKEIKIIVEIRY